MLFCTFLFNKIKLKSTIWLQLIDLFVLKHRGKLNAVTVWYAYATVKQTEKSTRETEEYIFLSIKGVGNMWVCRIEKFGYRGKANTLQT